jgi:hypothetical protein
MERDLDSRALCTNAPALTNSDPQNAANWRKAVAASAELPARLRDLHAAWSSVKKNDRRGFYTDRLAAAMDHMVIAIKTAFEAMRAARP